MGMQKMKVLEIKMRDDSHISLSVQRDEFSLRCNYAEDSFAIIHYLCRLVIETQARYSYDWPICSSRYA